LGRPAARRRRGRRRGARERRARPAVAQRGLDARRAPPRPAAWRGRPVGIELVGDRLEAEAFATHRSDPLGQLGRDGGDAGPTTRTTTGGWLVVPAGHLAQRRDDSAPGRRGSIQADVQGHEITFGGDEPVEQADQPAQRSGRVGEPRDEQNGRLASRDPLERLVDASEATAFIRLADRRDQLDPERR
jgi:hypothetical protein